MGDHHRPMVLLLLLVLTHTTRTRSSTTQTNFLDPTATVGLLPPECTNTNVSVIPKSPEKCAPFFSDAFLYNDTARALRSVQLMDSYPSATTLPTSAYSLPNVERFRALFRKLKTQNNTTVNIIVFGGSLTSGMHVGAHLAWSVQLEGMLRKRYPTHRINVVNRAEGGTTAHWALNRLHALFMDVTDTVVDLAVVDYDVNDCAVYNDNKGDRERVLAITEVFVRRLLGHATRPAVLFLNIAIMHKDGGGDGIKAHCSQYGTCYTMGEARWPVLSRYGVPLVSQKTALWSNFSCPPPKPVWPCIKFCSHPNAAAHEAVAKLLTAFLTGESAAHSAFARTLLPDPTFSATVTNGTTLPAAFLASQSVHVDSSMCHDPTLAISGQVRGSVSSVKTQSSARTANQGAVDGGGGMYAVDTDGFHPMGTPTVTLKSHVVNIDVLPTAGVAQYTPAFYAYMTDGQTGPMDTNATMPLTYSTVRINTTVGGQPLRFAYRTCWQHMEDAANKPGLVAEDCFNLTRTGIMMMDRPAGAPPATSNIFFPVTYGAQPRLTVIALITWPVHTGGYSMYFSELTGPQGTDVVNRLTATQMDPVAAETVLMALPWERTTFQDTKFFEDSKISIAKSKTFWPEPATVRAEHWFIGEMWPHWQIKPNTTYLCRIDHVDVNDKPWAKIRKEALLTGGKRGSPQKVKILSVSSC